MKTQYTLAQAVALIQRHYNRELSMIEFEDGSGRNFNFKFTGDDKKHFINVGVIERK